LLELIERKSRAEVSPMNEIILAKARLDQAKSENLQFKAQRNNSKSELEALIGQPFGDLKSPHISLIMASDLNTAINQAINYSPTLHRLSFESKAADADVDVAKSALWPQLSARSDEVYGGVAPGNTTYLALTYTPGNGLSSLSAAREAMTKKEVAESSIKSTTLEIQNRIRSDWNDYHTNLSQIEVLTNLAETSRGVYQSYIRQYELSKKTWVEVLNAKKESTQARYSLADAEWNSFIIGLRLQILTGLLTSSMTN
jgi:adhesin transport system outer membrane protein